MAETEKLEVSIDLVVSDSQFLLAKQMVNIYLEKHRDVQPSVHLVIPQEGVEYYRITT